jgi:hypothetical protein
MAGLKPFQRKQRLQALGAACQSVTRPTNAVAETHHMGTLAIALGVGGEKTSAGIGTENVAARCGLFPSKANPCSNRARTVIRVSSRGQQLSEADWNFISNFALAIDQEWITHLNKLKSKDDDGDKPPALELLQALNLHEPSQVDRIAAQASRRLLARGKIPVEDCVRIAHIFAALDATVPEDFQYAPRTCTFVQIKERDQR